MDGGRHDDRGEADLSRDLFLRDQRIEVFRVSAERVLDDPVDVAKKMMARAAYLSSGRSASPHKDRT